MLASDQTSIDKYYKSSNSWKKTSIIFGGVSASFYLYDIIWVFGKGFKNILNKKTIKKNIKKSEYQIQQQNFK